MGSQEASFILVEENVLVGDDLYSRYRCIKTCDRRSTLHCEKLIQPVGKKRPVIKCPFTGERA